MATLAIISASGNALLILMRSLAALLPILAMTPILAKTPDLAELQRMIARFAPVELRVDTSRLAPGDQQALEKLLAAARVIDDIFLTQYWSGNHALEAKLRKDSTPLGKARLHYFHINKSPWSDLDDHEAFLPDVPARKPLGANFYPEDMTRRGIRSLGEDAVQGAEARKPKASSPSSAATTASCAAVPFSQEYAADLNKLAGTAARGRRGDRRTPRSRNFSNLRAAAFLSNDYYASDVAWMDLDAPLDITIGPYETYNDELFGYKAAFEAYVNLRDDAETAKLKFFADHMQEIENNLPDRREVPQSEARARWRRSAW